MCDQGANSSLRDTVVMTIDGGLPARENRIKSAGILGKMTI